MRSIRCATALVLGLLLTACGGSSTDVNVAAEPAGTVAPSATATVAAADPFADCVDADLQRSSGVLLTTPVDQELQGLVLGSGKTGILFAAQSGGTLCQWLPMAQDYAAKGYRTAVFNYSYSTPDRDIVAMADALRAKGVTAIALVGASKGGTAVLSTAAETKAVAVVSLSGPTVYEAMNAFESIKSVTAPTWLGVGEGDTEFLGGVQELYAASKAPHKHIEIVKSAGHGVELLGDIQEKIATFLQTYAPAA